LEVARLVLQAKPDLVVLAGWMHVMSEGFLDALNGTLLLPDLQDIQRPTPVINLHPALPGAFDGVDAIHRAHEAFKSGEIKHTGVMVHRVVKEVDRGEPVMVREVPIYQEDDLAALEKRVHEAEWQVIVSATAKVLDQVKPALHTGS
jgi:phosphoribosylglycinamide formyltransferase